MRNADAQEKEMTTRMEGARSGEMQGVIRALQGTPERPQQMSPDDLSMIADQGGEVAPVVPAVPGDPNQAAMAALGSQFGDIRGMAPGLMNIAETRQNRAEDKVFRGEQAQAQRDFQMEQLRMRSEDARLSQQERIAAQQQLAQMQIQARNDAAEQQRAFQRESSRDRAAMVASSGGQKAPPGYRFKQDGNLEAIPGGPADAKAGEAAEKTNMRQDAALSRANLVIDKVEKALDQTGILTTGVLGAMSGITPGMPAYNYQKTLDTIIGNIGFQELQAMREASPTGGALGQVAVKELEMLQSVLSSLDRGQSRAQQTENLQAVGSHFENWKNTVRQARGLKPEPKKYFTPSEAKAQKEAPKAPPVNPIISEADRILGMVP
jgi:hypothetical protein